MQTCQDNSGAQIVPLRPSPTCLPVFGDKLHLRCKSKKKKKLLWGEENWQRSARTSAAASAADSV